MTRTFLFVGCTLVATSLLCAFVVDTSVPMRAVIGAGFLSLTLGLITVAAAITELGENR